MSEAEIATLQKLAEGSDVYGGGHIGTGWGSNEGPLETLMAGCCGRRDFVVLVTIGNPTFEGDTPRRQLLQLSRGWHAELLKDAEKNDRRPK